MSGMTHTLLPQLNSLLANIGKQKSLDKDGNTVYADMKIFSDEDLEVFLQLAESATKSSLKVENAVLHPDLVVEYAMYLALMQKSLVEKGREFAIEDNGMYYNPPNLSNHMMDVAANVINNWFRKVQLIRG